MADRPNIFDQDEDFWALYLKGRPQIPDSFYERIFAYHNEHSGHFEDVHDAGAGVGVQSARLAKRFKRVAVSDASGENIRIARTKLGGDEQFSFHVMKLEDSSGVPNNSVDMVHCGVMLHLTDVPRAIEAIARQLRPCGTLAATYCGVPALRDTRAQAVWQRIYHTGYRQLFERVRNISASAYQQMKELAVVATSAYDAIELPDELYEPGAIRLHLNEPEGWTWYEACINPELRGEMPPYEISGKEGNITHEVEDGWAFETGIDGLRAIAGTMTFDQSGDGFKQLWQELEGLLDGKKVKGIWPASLLLATKKRTGGIESAHGS